MDLKFPINVRCKTDGKGLWNKVERKINHKRSQIRIHEWSVQDFLETNKKRYLYGEFRVFFNKKDWNIYNHGLIYTDPQWLNHFRTYLMSIGFSKKASRDVDFSEQGMQGDNYVSLDIGYLFIKEYLLKFKKIESFKKFLRDNIR